jgi:hypothetical protein
MEPRKQKRVVAPLDPPYPHFIIIGAPKCGTSWLLAALGQHPNVIVVPDEIEYFSSYRRNPTEWYRSQFQEQVDAVFARKATPYVLGEKSAGYCVMGRKRIQAVHRLLPEVRLILMARDPVDRHWSGVKRRFSKERYAEQEGSDVLAVPRERLFELLGRARALGDYATMIDKWTSVYPAERLLLVSQEHTVANPRATFDAVLEHIGVSAEYDLASIRMLVKQKNRGPVVPMPDDVREFLEQMFDSERQQVRELFRDTGVVNAASLTAQPAPSPTRGRLIGRSLRHPGD